VLADIRFTEFASSGQAEWLQNIANNGSDATHLEQTQLTDTPSTAILFDINYV
jgi:hypothetical protein